MYALLTVALLLQDPSAEELVKRLSNEDVAVRETAVAALVRIGKPAVPALEAARPGADADLGRQIDRILRKIKTGWFTDPREAAQAFAQSRLTAEQKAWKETVQAVELPEGAFAGSRVFTLTYKEPYPEGHHLPPQQFDRIARRRRVLVGVDAGERPFVFAGACADLRALAGGFRGKDEDSARRLGEWWTTLLRRTQPYEVFGHPVNLPDRPLIVLPVDAGGFTVRYALDYCPFSGRADLWKDAVLHLDAEGRVAKIVWEMTTRAGKLLSTKTDE